MKKEKGYVLRYMHWHVRFHYDTEQRSFIIKDLM